MSEKIKIIIPTKQKNNTFNSSNTYECLQSILVDSTVQKNLDINCIVQPIFENSRGLSDLYQDELNKNDVDYIFSYSKDENIWVLVPIKETNSSSMTIRKTLTKNNQTKKTNYIKYYQNWFDYYDAD